MFHRLKSAKMKLAAELKVLRLVLKHPRTPLLAKVLLGAAVGYLLLPFDLIPDWVPVLGYLDDLVVVPVLIVLALKLVPDEVIEECRGRAEQPRIPGAGSERGRLMRDLTVIVALVALVGVPSLFTRDLWNPDEPRYMEVAREMVVLKDYLIPHLNGEVYSEKPPMFFWLAGFLWKAGVGYSSARILSILAVVGALTLTYLAARRFLGPHAALLAVGVALSTAILLNFTKTGVLDPFLMFLTAISVFFGYLAFRPACRHRTVLWLGCYAAMGLGTLTKGPVGFLVPGLVLLAFGLANRRKVVAAGRCHLIGVGVLVAIVFAWLIPAIVAGGHEYARTILVKQNVGRAVQSYSHRNPFYYYLVLAPVYFFPWSFILPLAMVAAVVQWRRGEEDLPFFAFVWVAVTFVFFSLISGKRANYVLPVTPAVGILCGWYLTSKRRTEGGLPRAERILMRAAFVALGLVALALIGIVVFHTRFLSLFHLHEEETKLLLLLLTPVRLTVAALMTALVLGLCVWGFLIPQVRAVKRAVVLIAAVLLLSLALDLPATPVVNKMKSGKGFATVARKHAAQAEAVYLYQNDYSGVYNLYTGYVRMPVIRTPKQLRHILDKAGVLVIGDARRIDKALTPAEKRRYLVYRERVGHRVMLLMQGARSPARSLGKIEAEASSGSGAPNREL